MSILEVKNIRKSFGSHEVLKDISFSLEEGQVVSIIGSSGSGKTTLLRCINMLERATGGSVSVRGETIFNADDPVTHRERDLRSKRLHFGFVFQDFNLFPQYTALRNVMLATELQAKARPDYKANRKAIQQELREEAIGFLKNVGLGNKLDSYPHQLSGGQKQRVAIARALAMKPDILCFDEPTSALDPELTGEVLRVIRELADGKTTMIIVTHEMAFARDVADQVIFMDKGVIVEQGDAKEIINNPKEQRTRQFLSRYAQDNKAESEDSEA